MDEADYFNMVRSGCPDEETFLQEYMCVPSDDVSAFMSYELLDSANIIQPKTGNALLKLRLPKPTFVGVDITRDHDLTVIWVMKGLASLQALIEMQTKVL